jgi:hypothetical protein
MKNYTQDQLMVELTWDRMPPTALGVGSWIIQIDSDAPKQNPAFLVNCDGGARKDQE